MKIQYGCAPINWSNDDLPSLGGELTYQQCLSEMALAGYTGSEGGIKYPKDFDVIKKAIDLRGITICNMWFSTEFTVFNNEDTFRRFQKHLDYTYGLGARVVGAGECGVTIHGDESIPLFKNRVILDERQFNNLAEGLNELGRMAQAKGMKLCFHPHAGTGIETKEEIDRLMAMTNPETVFLLFDTGHLTLAGEDPLAVLEKHLDRVAHIHVKDVRRHVYETVKEQDMSFLQGVKNGMFTVPGDGDMVNWDGIFDLIKNSSYEGWIVVEAEQDPAKADPLEYAMMARRFLREKLGQ
ncbi:myo-inosose-2 dehydratase [Anoxynatronum buryatiense]|uniref:2-keto-myo-inositol dehydratase n=1 Tax=Anoxynatronum buryatiense TaxID=489973 RepID=A0AA46AHB6_9CLOT|nr:myo-inosose-2 dehydratase [Anoxynatronum buryatiense]SMP38526.1 2-keto-myo-inositol dehydratase [Anoxynatronum buryatiense]